jgi:hypothetical protein
VKITHSIAIGAKRRDRDNSTNDVKGRGRSRSTGGPSHQWGHEEVMALISYKHKEQIVLKQVIDPRANIFLQYNNGTSFQTYSNHTLQDSKNWQNVQRQVELHPW